MMCMDNSVMALIGKRISARRKRLRVTQKDLAEIAGVSVSTISAIELGKANPSIALLTKISKPIGLVVSLSERVVIP